MIERDPTDEEIAWVLGYVARKGWTPGRKGIVAHREAVQLNGHLGGRPSLDPEQEELRLEHIKRIRESDRSQEAIEQLQAKYERDKERFKRLREIRGSRT